MLFLLKEPTFVHKNCINIIENRFKEPSIRLFFTERTTFSSFDIRANPVESAALILYLSQIFTKPRFNEYLHY